MKATAGCVLRMERITKSRDAGFTLRIPLLEFLEGRIYGIVGPNGSGKTTLLNLLNFLEKPRGGDIFFKGERIVDSNRVHLSVRRKMHMIIENPLLFSTTVFNNVASGLKIRSIPRREWPLVVREALYEVGLEGFENRRAHMLSRGETQRVAIARALAVKPEVLLMDEPFTNIEKGLVALLEKMIQTINEKYGTTIIFTTHDLHQAYRLSHEVISLVDGRVVNGSLENFFTGALEEDDHSMWVRISPSFKVAVIAEGQGKVRIAIPPHDIVLSRSHLDSSARNSFEGMVTKVHLEGERVRVSATVADGVELIALITRASLEEMHLSAGSPVFLTFKSTCVTVF